MDQPFGRMALDDDPLSTFPSPFATAWATRAQRILMISATASRQMAMGLAVACGCRHRLLRREPDIRTEVDAVKKKTTGAG